MNPKIISIIALLVAIAGITLLPNLIFIDKTPVSPIGYTSGVVMDAPFVAQAPLGNWEDARQAYGCEETSAIMAMHWLKGEGLSPEEAIKEITAIADYEVKNYGYHEDTSAKDTLDRIIKGYFKYDNASLAYGIGIEDIKNELSKSNLVIVPVKARELKNPYYKTSGPHMILIIGYDDKAKEFITHDPGTKFGKNFRYSYATMAAALQDYESGKTEPVKDMRTAMIVVSKP